ncbi:MAG: hypothetical protein O2931_06320 [Planctomycetota bacterium]|nr:hypothetical protein [Planctomycetota bacterium]
MPIKKFYARFWHLIRTTCFSYDNGRVLVLGAIYSDRSLLQVIANMAMTGRIARRKIAAVGWIEQIARGSIGFF